ncbi:MAG: hypothetical protein KTR31_05725 [Myxococcales bacterium]|nr:hypothetical protein [Myxococcales bacterium]
MDVDKGTRVEIVSGRKGKGVCGSVFWIGEDRYKEGAKRLGIHGDDGETYWVSADYVEPTDAPEPEPEGPEPGKGDRVSFPLEDDERGEGQVFWVGPSKQGGGTRIGVQCDDGETRWFDTRRVTLLSEATGGGEPPPTEGPQWDEEEPPF